MYERYVTAIEYNGINNELVRFLRNYEDIIKFDGSGNLFLVNSDNRLVKISYGTMLVSDRKSNNLFIMEKERFYERFSDSGSL